MEVREVSGDFSIEAFSCLLLHVKGENAGLRSCRNRVLLGSCKGTTKVQGIPRHFPEGIPEGFSISVAYVEMVQQMCVQCTLPLQKECSDIWGDHLGAREGSMGEVKQFQLSVSPQPQGSSTRLWRAGPATPLGLTWWRRSSSSLIPNLFATCSWSPPRQEGPSDGVRPWYWVFTRCGRGTLTRSASLPGRSVCRLLRRHLEGSPSQLQCL